MSTSYFIAPAQPTKWQIQPEQFIHVLKTRWLGIQITWIDDPRRPYLVQWRIVTEKGEHLEGMLNRKRQGFVLEGSLEECAEFAVWFQSQYPERKDFIFFDEQTSFDIDLLGRSAEEVIKLARQDFSFFSEQ